MVLEKTLESPLDSKEIQPVNPKGNQSWILIGRTDVEAETLILLPPDVKNWLIWKDPDAGKDWWQEEKGTIEDEMVGWHHRLNGHEFAQAPRVGDGLRNLVWCSLWHCKESDMTELLNWTELNWHYFAEKGPSSQSYWRRQWHPTPVLLPGKSHGQRSLEGCSPWGCWGSDMTERLHFHFSLSCIGEGNGNLL